MIRREIAEVIKERIRICEETQDNWGDGIEHCWKKCVEIIIADIDKSIAYFRQECTDEELFWLSEIFEDIAKKTQSKELIQALRDRLLKVTPESYRQQNFKSEHMRKWVDYKEYVEDIAKEIEYAENTLKG